MGGKNSQWSELTAMPEFTKQGLQQNALYAHSDYADVIDLFVFSSPAVELIMKKVVLLGSGVGLNAEKESL